ncbi:hypothetical protein CU097_009658 [Rhizopus azygosporus]|uniref:Mid2 domain-containing protein n=1 Tax=Rhizopus azygosporus TaxID=86630 RepID=A0A367JMH5_RHIAZ|nr:hypothetical protein CU097_009658 [Rhizopus azygosporus]
MLLNIKISLAVFTLFYTLAHTYKIVYCDDNGCTSEKYMTSDPDLSFNPTTTSFSVVATSTSSRSTDYNTIVHTTSLIAKSYDNGGTSFSDSSEWKIIAGSLGGIIGAAIIATAIFAVRYIRTRRSGLKQDHTDDANQTRKCWNHGDANRKRISTNGASSIPVFIVPMDDVSNSLPNREWKQLTKAAYQQDWYKLNQDSPHRHKNKDEQEDAIRKEQTGQDVKLESPQAISSTSSAERS